MTDPTPLAISVIWPDVDDLPVFRANNFVIQVTTGPQGTPEDVVLTIGHVSPPFVLGTPDEQQAAAAAIGAVPAKAVARISMSPARLGELAGLLAGTFHQLTGGGGGEQ